MGLTAYATPCNTKDTGQTKGKTMTTFTKIENGEYKSSNGLWITFNEFNYGYPVWVVTQKGIELFHTKTLQAAKAKVRMYE